MTFKLLVMDLDGTILPTEGSISSRVKAAIREVQDRGVLATLASGRTFASMVIFARELGISAPLICHQGALVKDPVTGRVFYEDLIPVDVMRDVVVHAREHHLHLNVYIDDETYMERSNGEIELYSRLSRIQHQAVPDLLAALKHNPTKCIWVSETPEKSDALLPLLQQSFGSRLSVVRSHPYLIEGVPLGVSKGKALAFLAGCLGITQAETVAIGDSDNDADMLQWAGLGLAMGNSTPLVLTVADCVVPSIDDDGVAFAIERYVLDGSRL